MSEEQNIQEQGEEVKTSEKSLDKLGTGKSLVSRLGFLKKIKPSKQHLLIILAVVAVIAIGWLLKATVFKGDPKQIYQVVVQVRSQYNADPVEDRKTSLKKGDVLVVQDAEHKFSTTERKSYLILNMKLSEKQRNMLMQGEEREISDDELSKEEKEQIEEEKKRAKEDGREYEPERRTETLRMRMYYIDLNRPEFEGFQWQQLLDAQPYTEEVFGWEIIAEKPTVEEEIKQKAKK